MSNFEPPYDTDYIVHLYVDKEFSLAEITEHLSCNSLTPAKHLKKAGVEIRDRGGVPIKSENNKFKPPLSHTGAYFLGLLFADGNLRGNKYGVRITSKDYSILKKFLEFVEFDGDLKKANNNCKVAVVCRKWLHDRLMNLGLIANKSNGDKMLYNDGYEKYIQGFEIERSYWRGVIDGDGSIRYNSEYPRFYFSNSVLDAHKKLNKYLVEKGFAELTTSERKNGRWYESYRTHSKSVPIVSHLYQGELKGPVIGRKKEYFEDKYLNDDRYF